MAYAVFDDVQARAGRFGAYFTVQGRRPSQADVESFLADCAAQIDAALGSRGHATPVTGTAAAALLDVNAYGALSRALAAVPEDAAVETLQTRSTKIWGAAMGDPTAVTHESIIGSIRSGGHPVIALLESGVGAGASAGSFWEAEPTYGSALTAAAELERARLEPADVPVFSRLQSL